MIHRMLIPKVNQKWQNQPDSDQKEPPVRLPGTGWMIGVPIKSRKDLKFIMINNLLIALSAVCQEWTATLYICNP